MALDGCVIAALTDELSRTLTGGRISKISMPEKDELLIQIKNNGETYRLLISAGASLPLMYLADENKPAPLQAPAFCMLLRKHLSSAVIKSVTQTGLERIICIEFDALDELEDPCVKRIYTELMGKYSNIIFTDDNNVIIDSIKRVPESVSSLREVLPRRDYYLPEELRKINPLSINPDDAFKIMPVSSAVSDSGTTVSVSDPSFDPSGFLFKTYEGLSPLIAEEIVCRGENGFAEIMDKLSNADFSPVLISRHGEPKDFSAFRLKLYEGSDYEQIEYESISKLLQDFYAARDERTRVRQKSVDLRKIVTTALERAVKKLTLQEKQLKDCAGKEKYKVYGDLLNTYGYALKGGEKSFTCENYYDEGKEITIPLDEHKTAQENAKRYFDKYQKLRRTEIALSEEVKNTENDVEHLSSILQSIEMSRNEADLNQIRKELSEYGYVKKAFTPQGIKGLSQKGSAAKASPLHFISSDGYDIYVGKNNYQNEEVSFTIGDANDWWFHAKGVPGSHVIVKVPKGTEPESIPDRVFEEAASLAAYFSKNSNGSKVDIDYTLRKNLKRTPGGPPGFVIYHTNYSMVATPELLKATH